MVVFGRSYTANVCNTFKYSMEHTLCNIFVKYRDVVIIIIIWLQYLLIHDDTSFIINTNEIKIDFLSNNFISKVFKFVFNFTDIGIGIILD